MLILLRCVAMVERDYHIHPNLGRARALPQKTVLALVIWRGMDLEGVERTYLGAYYYVLMLPLDTVHKENA